MSRIEGSVEILQCRLGRAASTALAYLLEHPHDKGHDQGICGVPRMSK